MEFIKVLSVGNRHDCYVKLSSIDFVDEDADFIVVSGMKVNIYKDDLEKVLDYIKDRNCNGCV